MRYLMATVSAAAMMAVTTGSASAGGFAVREQSVYHQGASFAGSAAGGALSSMFWNSAAAAFAPGGIYMESNYSAILGNVEITAEPGSTLFGALPSDSGNIAKPAVVPASYTSMRLSENVVFALGINSPFGLVTEPSNRFWAGQTHTRTSEIKTYNFNPTLAYRFSPTLAVGVGLQIEHIEGRLKSASGVLATSRNVVIKGDDTAFGFTLGVMYTPTANTTVGLGWRSSIDHTLEGTTSIPGSPVPPADAGVAIKAGTTLPDIVTLSIRHALSSHWTLLGTVEWTRWSNVDGLTVRCANTTPNAVFCPAGNGQQVRRLELGWDDGWFFALGAEYAANERTTLRFGVAYEKSPIHDPDERSLRVPDTDRLWVSVGGTYRWSEMMTFDVAYSHIFGIGDDAIDRTEGGVRFIGNVDANVDILSVGARIKLGAPPAPLK